MATVVKFTSAGSAIVTALLAASNVKYCEIGTDGTAAAVTDTALVGAVETRATGTQTQQTTDHTNDTYQVVGTVTATAARAVQEAGLFDASTSGNLYISASFDTINLATDDSLELTFKCKHDHSA